MKALSTIALTLALSCTPVFAQSGRVKAGDYNHACYTITDYQHYISAVNTRDNRLYRSLLDENRCVNVGGLEYSLLRNIGTAYQIRVYWFGKTEDVWIHRSLLY